MALVTQENVDAVAGIKDQAEQVFTKAVELRHLMIKVFQRVELNNPLNDEDWEEFVAKY